ADCHCKTYLFSRAVTLAPPNPAAPHPVAGRPAAHHPRRTSPPTPYPVAHPDTSNALQFRRPMAMEEEEISGKELLRPDNSLAEEEAAAAASRLTDDLIVEILSRLPFRENKDTVCQTVASQLAKRQLWTSSM
uniref:F-box domain-containing protein n=1 Tax=Aegilops tauschii subsp. strangulata TaxID=200361 RepID=A0A452XJM3_AEGTS